MAAILLMLAAGLRLYGLGQPDTLVSDERFYAVDGAAYVADSPPTFSGSDPIVLPSEQGGMTLAGEQTWFHPPLGKELISAGIRLAGFTPLGWRLAPALFGIVGVLLVYLLALALLGSPWWAGLAGLFVAVDGLHVVHSRIAMLDIFLTTFLTAAVLCLVMEGRTHSSLASPRHARASPFHHVAGPPWRLAAGALFGAALATKWSAVFLLVPAATLTAAVSWRRSRAGWRARAAGIGRVGLALVVVPVAVYLVSYVPLFLHRGVDPGGFVSLQRQMFDYQTTFQQANPQASPALAWPLMTQPFHYYPVLPNTDGSVIVGVGNPVVWWGFLLLLPMLAWAVIARRDVAGMVAAGGYLCLYVPWLLVGRTEFFYYLLPAVPFMAVGISVALRAVAGERRWVGAAAAGSATAAAVAFLPFWLGFAVPAAWVDHLHWIDTWR